MHTSSTFAGRNSTTRWFVIRAGEGKVQVKRGFRLTRSTDIKRVRRSGKSYAHPLVVLYVLKSDVPETHVGVSAGLAVGNAVKRNRAKRLLRAAMNELIPVTVPGSDLLLVARSPLSAANVYQTREALSILLKRAGLLSQAHDV
jgi:ribonuclease P protein component